MSMYHSFTVRQEELLRAAIECVNVGDAFAGETIDGDEVKEWCLLYAELGGDPVNITGR